MTNFVIKYILLIFINYNSMRYSLFIALILSLVLTSCVSKKKYTELEDSRTSLKNEVLRLREVAADHDEFMRRYQALQSDFQNNQKNLAEANSMIDNLKAARTRLQEDYDDLLEDNKALMRITSEEKESLSGELVAKQKELNDKETQLYDLSLELKRQERDLQKLQESIAEREQKISKLQNQITMQQSELQAVKDQISRALLDFPEEDLTIEQKNGKVYVSLSQNLLFATGSDKIDHKGIEALEKLAFVLKDNNNINIVVEGHTDDVGSTKRNWELSTERSLSVLRVLQDHGVNPTLLTASGRAFYAPVVPNDSKENRALNRRTEIILSPDLTNLFKLIDIE